ncbi:MULTISPECIES: DEAD/DEAH box helicase [Prevotellaceae]|uniref:DEAD/DEAH box helicase n=1 Tax=Leyella stercorea TaxID=363265 RepID=UPI002430A5FD|nr:DEAD/DEAH box helicase [Leyella stercorea]
MKLIEGTYENLITDGLKHDMLDASEEGLVCKKEDIDGAEEPSMLTEHISRIIRNRLKDENLTTEERASFVNRLIDFLGEDDDEKLADDKQMLSAVVSLQEESRLKATKQTLVRPLTGFRTSNLFTGGHGGVSLSSEIERDIESADSICMIVSFLKLSGVNLIYDKLKRFCNNSKHRLRIITTTYCGVTDAKAVERLAGLPNTEIRISYNTEIERLHAKSYIFERNSGFSTAYIGSSNLSKSAQTDGLEWNIRVTNVENPHIIDAALATFNIYWNSNNFEDFRVGGVDKLYKELKRIRTPKIATDVLSKYTILPHQKQILDRLCAIREGGVKRNLVVAATGTGKTVISAFDYKLFTEQTDGKHRLLFIAHRQEILKQSRLTYRSVLQNANFGDVWVGDSRPVNGIDHLFVSVQTFNSKFDSIFSRLPDNYYDYIVIDEAHHLVADSYRTVLDKFKPQLLIGLTATPERMDGVSLLPDFDNQISAEIRLPKALDEGLLTPFQYLCISDDTDLTDDELMQGDRYVATKLTEKLCNKERVGLIVNRLQYYLPDEHGCRALAFCATKRHAQYMAERFCDVGLKAAFLTSDNDEERQTLNKQLAKGEINYLFVVDIFNEGVDIPSVDTVLFLRPTESLTVFLQQLGRGLRLYPGKQQLTVFDFVAQLNKKYDFASRFRSLLTRTDKSVAEQVKNGFTLLPHGCTIHMEEKARDYVLQNIKAAIYNKKRLVKELRTYTSLPSLGEFIANNGQDIRLIYKGGNCWSSLKKEAGLCVYAEDENTKRFTKGIGNLVHVNSLAYIHFIRKVMKAKGRLTCDGKQEETFAVMLYYSLFGDKISKVGVKSIGEALARLAHYPVFVAEVLELTNYLVANVGKKTFAVGEGMPATLEQYGCYTREEVFAIFDRQTADKKMQGSVAGVFNIDELNTELFFVTLNKSDKDFSAETMYNDYVVSENEFHWESKNTDTHAGRGGRYVRQKENGKKFLLFVRENKQDGFGNTCPFICFGLIDYISSKGDKPMKISWRTHQPILPSFLSAV